MTRKFKKLRIFAALAIAFNFNLLAIPTASADDAAQALANALINATTQVQEAVDASNVATSTIETATVQAQEANATVPVIQNLTETATATIQILNGSITNLLASDTSTITQSSDTVTIATNAVATAQQYVQMLDSAITNAQTQLTEARAARIAVDTATANANTQFIQANQAIAQAQSAVNTLQATISTTRSVLANTDDAGVLMVLPFQMLMGNTLYSNVYLGSNAVITFGTDQGWVYYTTPSAPSVSVGGFDWTTWSQGSGITYSTTVNTLSIAWDVRAYPTRDHSVQMTQLRFDAEVNPNTGAWIANVSGVGPYVDNARWNYRQTTNGTITQIVDSNPVSNQFEGSLGQGTYTPIVVQVDTSTAIVRAQIDSATATIQDLNSIISTVVTRNNTNNSAVSTIPSTSGVQPAINSANGTIIQITSKTDTITAIVATIPTTLNTNNSTATIPETTPIVYIIAPIYNFEQNSQGDANQNSNSSSGDEQTTGQPQEQAPSEDSLSQEQDSSQEQQAEQTDSPEETQDTTQNDQSQNDSTIDEQQSKDEAVNKILEKADGEPVTAEALKEAGLEYKDLPPATPVEVRVDLKGNPVIITAEVASALQAFESPAQLINAIAGCLIPDNQKDPNDPQKCEIFTALANIGADMSPAEREKAQDIVVVTILANQMIIGSIMRRRAK